MGVSSKCKKCGACCKVFGVVESAGLDDENLTMSVDELPYKTMKIRDDGSCICLKSDNTCSVYKKRPDICKIFKPGGFWCKYARSKI